jgi:predicted RNA polymerase sigma factor
MIEPHRAVAVNMAFGVSAGLEVVDRLKHDPALAAYHRLPSPRDLLFELGRLVEARGEFERAASLAQNTRECKMWLARAAEFKK